MYKSSNITFVGRPDKSTGKLFVEDKIPKGDVTKVLSMAFIKGLMQVIFKSGLLAAGCIFGSKVFSRDF